MARTLDGTQLTLEAIDSTGHGDTLEWQLAPDAKSAMEASRKVVEDLVERGEVAYGITTGFGEFAHVSIEREQVRTLQRNLVLSHAVGVGAPLEVETVRAMMLIRANTLSRGFSGVRPIVVERLLELLGHDCIPVVPSRGSVGSSGDLAPLSHIASALIGVGNVQLKGDAMSSEEAHAKLGIEPLVLEAKEGLGLINGTQMMSGLGTRAVLSAERLLEDAQITAAMSIEALMGSTAPFDPDVHALRGHPGQAKVAAKLLELTAGSKIVESHADCDRVQDAYSIRCTPQVLGACMDAIARARTVMKTEVNSVTDNPLVFPDGRIISQGNFHGEPLAIILDHLAVAVAEIGNIAERRIERMVNPDLSEGLKPFLVERGGLNSGFMIAQYTAAALVSENKGLCHPASVDSIPTSANQEDHNSMGSIAALKLPAIIQNVRTILAIEALCAAQALEARDATPGVGSAAALAAVRSVVSALDEDRYLAPDVEALTVAMRDGCLRGGNSP